MDADAVIVRPFSIISTNGLWRSFGSCPAYAHFQPEPKLVRDLAGHDILQARAFFPELGGRHPENANRHPWFRGAGAMDGVWPGRMQRASSARPWEVLAWI